MNLQEVTSKRSGPRRRTVAHTTNGKRVGCGYGIGVGDLWEGEEGDLCGDGRRDALRVGGEVLMRRFMEGHEEGFLQVSALGGRAEVL